MYTQNVQGKFMFIKSVFLVQTVKNYCACQIYVHLTRWCRMSHCCSPVYEEVVDCWARLCCFLFHKT